MIFQIHTYVWGGGGCVTLPLNPPPHPPPPPKKKRKKKKVTDVFSEFADFQRIRTQSQ